MKKILAFILAAVLALSLVACGGGGGAGDNNTPSEDINPNDVAIGTWKGECDVSEGRHMIFVLKIYKGGTCGTERYLSDARGSADNKYNNNDPSSSLPGTWEIIDDVLNITENGFWVSSLGFDFDIEQEPLTALWRDDSDDLVLTKVS